VADNGPKLDDEAFARLTQASDSTSGGLGLGLGIIRSIADAHSQSNRPPNHPINTARDCMSRVLEEIKQ